MTLRSFVRIAAPAVLALATVGCSSTGKFKQKKSDDLSIYPSQSCLECQQYGPASSAVEYMPGPTPAPTPSLSPVPVPPATLPPTAPPVPGDVPPPPPNASRPSPLQTMRATTGDFFRNANQNVRAMFHR